MNLDEALKQGAEEQARTRPLGEVLALGKAPLGCAGRCGDPGGDPGGTVEEGQPWARERTIGQVFGERRMDRKAYHSNEIS